MSPTRIVLSSLAALFFVSVAVAQAPAGAPAGSTGLCRDGSYWSNATKQGACRGHKGIQDWYGAPTTASSAPAAAPAAPAASSPPSAAPAPMPAPAAAVAVAPRVAPAAPTTPAAGGGNGQVWVNSSSKVYHCPSDRWYGKTKNGVYMSEADALAQGNHADHGKACAK